MAAATFLSKTDPFATLLLLPNQSPFFGPQRMTPPPPPPLSPSFQPRRTTNTQQASSSSSTTLGMSPTSPSTTTKKRGIFVVLEGIDRCGKTTQCKLLQERFAAKAMNFPNRSTRVGTMIHEYLTTTPSSNENTTDKESLNDETIHLLFSANRWEASGTITQTLLEHGQHIVCDRYAYSGVAFSSAKLASSSSSTDNPTPALSMDWCMAPDKGLPAPDCVIFLDLEQDQAEQRGGYGNERYEKRDMQLRVRQQFAKLQAMDQQQERNERTLDTKRHVVEWHVVNAAQSIEEVQEELATIVQETIAKVHGTEDGIARPLGKMWCDGFYES